MRAEQLGAGGLDGGHAPIDNALRHARIMKTIPGLLAMTKGERRQLVRDVTYIMDREGRKGDLSPLDVNCPAVQRLLKIIPTYLTLTLSERRQIGQDILRTL